MSESTEIGLLFDSFADDYHDVRDEVGWNPWPHIHAFLGEAKSLDGVRVLDVGCGAGAVMEKLLERGAEVIGVDASERMCELTAERLPGVPVFWRDLNDGLPFEDGTFDVTIAMGCLEFLTDVEAGCRELLRVTRIGGRVLYLVEILGDGLDGGRSKIVELYELWTRHRLTMDEAAAFASTHLHDADIKEIPGYIQDESGLPVSYCRVMGSVTHHAANGEG